MAKADFSTSTRAPFPHYANLERGIIATGGVALVLSIAANLQFYGSLGESTPGIIIYTAVGALLTIIAIMVLPAAFILWEREKPLPAVFFAFLWVMLVVLSVIAEYGYFAQQQTDKELTRAAASTPAILAQKRLEAAQEQKQALSAYQSLDPGAIQTELAASREEERTIGKRLADCPEKHFIKCINPLTEKLSEQRRTTAEIAARLSQAQRYSKATNEHTDALTAVEKTGLPGTANAIAPVYIWVERLTGIAAGSVQVFTTAVIVIVLELWASLAAYLITTLSGRELAPLPTQPLKLENETANAPTQPLNAPTALNATVAAWQNGTCNRCGKEFIRQVKWQKFCCEPCRVANWEERTGAKVKR